MNSFATQKATNYSSPPTPNTTSTATFQCAELAVLLNGIMKAWKDQPNHFGYQKFDDFLKKLPEYYYQLLQQYQRQILLQQQQQQQLQMQQNNQHQNMLKSQNVNNNLNHVNKVRNNNVNTVNTINKQQPISKIESKPEPQSSVLKSTQSKRGYKVRASRRPKLQAIEEEQPLTPSPSPSPPSAERLNAFAPEFSPLPASAEPTVSYSKLHPFVPKHAARAKLNIYIPKHMTKLLKEMICEQFPNTNTLYYYLDITTALQINDKQMELIQTKSGEKIVIVNFDLHKKGTNEALYAVVTPNDQHKIEANTEKWLWKLNAFMTENEIFNKYEILRKDFPKSSRAMNNGIYQKFAFQHNKLNDLNNDIIKLLSSYKWESNEIKIIGSSQKSKKGRRAPELKLNLSRNEWINQCMASWNNNCPAIPIVVYENRDINKHWIEWVKLIYIQQSQSFIGITFKYDDNNNKWCIESICLDKGDIHNKHRLIGLQNIESRHNINYDQYFVNFNTKITEIQWR